MNIFGFNLTEEEEDWLIIDPAPEVDWEAGMSAETWLLTELVHLVLFFALLYTHMHMCACTHTCTHTHTHTLLCVFFLSQLILEPLQSIKDATNE